MHAVDRHLFELAFLVAAQFETLRNVSLAIKYYHEALGSVPYIRNSSERNMSHVVVLDRIAQCHQDQCVDDYSILGTLGVSTNSRCAI
jgi:hypothetical protein